MILFPVTRADSAALMILAGAVFMAPFLFGAIMFLAYWGHYSVNPANYGQGSPWWQRDHCNEYLAIFAVALGAGSTVGMSTWR